MCTTFGIQQRLYGTEKPAVWDKQTRKICIDIQPARIPNPDQQKQSEDEETEMVDGWRWFETTLGPNDSLNYDSIKSQLIETAYKPKDEFGVLMNTLSALVKLLTEEQKQDSYIQSFLQIDEWRSLCAKAAKVVCKDVGTLPS